MSAQTARLPVWEVDMNPEQMRAIRHQDGPCCLVAAAGSGKTRALVHRIARMVAGGIQPRHILAVTFSKKAAGEMNERLDRLGVEGARVGTWHSLCLQILREDATPWAEWEVDESDAAVFLLKEALGYKFLDWKEADLGDVKRYISLCKANLHEPGSEGARAMAPPGHEGEMLARAYAQYQVLVEERGLLTFDDFLLFAHRHLTASEENRRQWASKWRYMLVDECQDNNVAQKTLQEMLARDHRNLMMVGDPFQSIYGWRGSTPDHMVEFATERGVEVVQMNRNYRSGKRIVEAANAVIRGATFAKAVDMVPERGVEGEVRVVPSEDYDAEGEELAALVEEVLQGGGTYGDITALFRTNAQSRALEEALLKKRISYVVVSGVSFYDRREVRDLLAYLRVATGRDNDGKAVRRCINAPFRYLGKAFVEKVEDEADKAEGAVQWVETVRKAAQRGGVQQRQAQSAEDWARIVEQLQRDVEEGGAPSASLSWLINHIQYIAWINRDQGEESLESSHVANVRELVRVAERFNSIGELVDYVDENAKAAKRQRTDRQAGGDRVLLMNIHRAKGLEWPHVFVAGCNEGTLPHFLGDPEEERRLMYVAMTRARDALVLSYVRRHARAEGVKDAVPSHFLVEAGLVGFNGEMPMAGGEVS